MVVSLLGAEVALHEALHAGCLVSRRFDRTPLAFRHEVDLAHAGHEIAVVGVWEVAVVTKKRGLREQLREAGHLIVQGGGVRDQLVGDLGVFQTVSFASLLLRRATISRVRAPASSLHVNVFQPPGV